MVTRKKIILAEDNIADVELTKMAFQEIGLPIDLIHVFDGQELVNYVKDNQLDDIALILLDLNMPRMGGVDVLKAFSANAEHNKLPVVVFSSSTHETDIMTCYGYGANAYVCKPIDINEFTKTINSIAQFWGNINVIPTYNN